MSSSGIPETNFSLVLRVSTIHRFVCTIQARKKWTQIMSGVALPLIDSFFFHPWQLFCCLMERLESHKSISRSASCNRRRWVSKLSFPTSIWAAAAAAGSSSTLRETWMYKIIFLYIQRKLFKQIKTGTLCCVCVDCTHHPRILCKSNLCIKIRIKYGLL